MRHHPATGLAALAVALVVLAPCGRPLAATAQQGAPTEQAWTEPAPNGAPQAESDQDEALRAEPAQACPAEAEISPDGPPPAGQDAPSANCPPPAASGRNDPARAIPNAASANDTPRAVPDAAAATAKTKQAAVNLSGAWEATAQGSTLEAFVAQKGPFLLAVAYVTQPGGKVSSYHMSGILDNGHVRVIHKDGYVFDGRTLGPDSICGAVTIKSYPIKIETTAVRRVHGRLHDEQADVFFREMLPLLPAQPK